MLAYSIILDYKLPAICNKLKGLYQFSMIGNSEYCLWSQGRVINIKIFDVVLPDTLLGLYKI